MMERGMACSSCSCAMVAVDAREPVEEPYQCWRARTQGIGIGVDLCDCVSMNPYVGKVVQADTSYKNEGRIVKSALMWRRE